MTERMPALNSQVPEFSAPMTGGQTFSLAAHAGRKLVLFFYPKDNTPGCIAESMRFRDLHDEFTAANCAIFGISRDSIRSHEGFKSKLGMPFELISDPDEAVCAAFEVMRVKSMYGKQVRGIERSTFVIDASGKMVKEWRAVKVPDHVDEVLAYVRTLA